MELHRFWIGFEAPDKPRPKPGCISLDEGDAWSRWLWRGCGVTAFNETDAMNLIRSLAGDDLPPVTSITVEVEADALPEYAQGAGVAVWRGIWFPPVNLRGPQAAGG